MPCVLCEDPDVLGTPFFIMHRAEGTAAGHKLAKMEANDALAAELGCRTVWSEDLNDGQEYGPVVVRNPFS